MTTEAMVPADAGWIMERVIAAGDLSRLTPADRVRYYAEVCASVGLNPLTQPLAFLTLNGKLVLYATKGATDQLRSIKGISIDRLDSQTVDDLYIVTAYGRDASGRQDTEVGAVPIAGLRGEAKANAILKATTKAKRRLTLSLSGLGFLDESEVSSIPSAERVDVDAGTGEIVRQAPRTLAAQVAERKAAVAESSGAATAVPPGEAAEVPPSPPPDHVAAADAGQCESASDDALGPAVRCRREEGHAGNHKTPDRSWPR